MSKFKVLIVEDTISEILPVKVLLESMGCDVEIGIDGLGAVENLVKNDYDLLVLDWLMPDFNGNQALEYAQKLIKQAGSTPKSLPFVAYTSLDVDKLEMPEGKDFKFVGHWKKPFNLKALEREMKTLLSDLKLEAA